ncbi:MULTISPECIES: flagellar protein FliT [Geobacillus]|uniref:Flagellar protein FliT n=1 Tax=Geobacillus stearothermophilus TaxID=1422 RepID=A0ABQ7HBQ2_GEOSE|nr:MULTISPECIES: flagellar protein FliT [Geobacillus]KAF6509628.1 Flagellar protein fliT [Geobacillus stearothermophilus]KMY58964.1 flagellar assembly protein FliT [Geobacillus stearothermophilus]KMY61046.1 flagellar assembly protein FliT [Geobacillus stearothermophilus]KMY61289.1 flagellar assembly protein FliT [Geobacillus stearothermophilus]MBR2517666.1 flagellar protein FliT [Geobacillus sp.]
MGVVHDVWRVTKELLEATALPWPSEEREERLRTVDRLLRERQELLWKLRPPYSEEEQRLGREIIAWNEEIERRLHRVGDEIRNDLRMAGAKRQANARYVHPYEQPLSIDGMFYDKKR